MKKVTQYLAVALTSLSLFLSIGLAPALARAVDPGTDSAAAPTATATPSASSDSSCNATTAKEALQCGAGVGPVNSDPTKSINHTFTVVINIFSVVGGILAVFMMVLAGYRYITSGGSQEKVKSAKDTILYAVIGLIVVALAQVIVQFVLNRSVTH